MILRSNQVEPPAVSAEGQQGLPSKKLRGKFVRRIALIELGRQRGRFVEGAALRGGHEVHFSTRARQNYTQALVRHTLVGRPLSNSLG